MAGRKPLQRKLRLAAALVPALVVLLVAGLSSSHAADPPIGDPGAASDVSSGLQSLAQSLGGLGGLDELGQNVPFTDRAPTGSDGLNFANAFVKSLKDQLAGQAFSSLTELQAYLNDPARDGDFAGVHVDVGSPTLGQTGGIYTLGLTLDLTRPGATAPLKLDTNAVNVDGGSLALTLHTTASLAVKYDPAQAPGNRVYLDGSSNPKVETTVGANANFSTSPFHVNLGFTDVTVGGTVDVGASVHTDILDPDGNGKITADEWSTTAAVNQFDVSFGSTHANAAITLTSDIKTPLNGSLPAATVSVADTDLTNGLDTPTVSLGPLGDFKNMQPQDFLSGIGSVAVMMTALSSTGPAGFTFPFLHHDPNDKAHPIVEHVSDAAKFNERLVDFFKTNGLSSTNDPLSVVLDPAKLQEVNTIQEVASKLETALGESPGDFGLRYDPTTKRLTFAIKVQRDAAHDPIAPISARVDVADQLKNIGLTDLAENGSTLQATVSPDYKVNLGVGVDLSPAGGQSVSQRFFVDTSGTEFQANVPISAKLDLVGRIGFLGIAAKSQLNGQDQTVQLLAPREVAKPMLKLDLNGGPDDRLTLKEVFDALGSNQSPANPLSILNASSADDVVNAAVPPFDLHAAATVNDDGTNVVQGTAHIRWDDVLDPSQLKLGADGQFNDELLDFDFDPDNPAAMFTKILDVLGPFTHQIADMAHNNPTLQQKLPVINKSFADLVTQFDTLRDQIDDLATDPAGFLQQFEELVQDKVAQAFGITDPTAIENILDIEAHHNSPTAVTFHLKFGICAQKAGAPADPDCSITHELKLPLNFDLPDVGGLVGIQNQGEIVLTAKAVAKLTFGVQLPDVSPSQSETGPPSISGSPALFVETNPAQTAINLDVGVDAQTVLSASIGPLTFSLGKAKAAEDPNAGQCGADTNDDDHDNVVNDGCLIDGTPENAAAGQCSNAFDDDNDGDVNDGCDAVGLPATARLGAKLHLSKDEGRLTINPSNLDNLTQWLGDIVPNSLAAFSPDTKVSCPGIPNTHDACVSIPVFAGSGQGSALLGNITATADPLDKWDAQVDPGILNNILGAELDWTTLVHGIKYVADNLQTQLDASTYGGKKLPVIGHALDGGAEVVRNFREKIVNPMDQLATELKGKDFATIQQKVKTFFVSNIGTDAASPFHLLTYDGAAGTADNSDVEVQLLCGTDEHPCVQGTDSLSSLSDAQIRFAVGGDVVNKDLDFDIGFPGLRLTVDKSSNPDENLHAKVGYRLDVNFGLSKKYGFYVQTDDPAPGRSAEMTLSAAVDMPASAHGDIAFLRLDISNNENAATHDDLSLELAADIKGGDTDTADKNHKKLGLDDIASNDPAKAADVAVSVTGGVHLNLHLITSIQMPEGISLGGAEGALPKLLADFRLDWGFGAGVSLNGGLDPANGADPLTVGFNNIKLDLGQFFQEFLGPIVREVQRWTKPLQPVIDTISAPIPGISDLSELAGAGPIAMLDFLENASGADLTVIRQIIKLVDLVNHLPTSGSTVDLGHFGLDENAVEGPAPTGDNADKLIDDNDHTNPGDVFNTPGQCSHDPCFSDNSGAFGKAMAQDPNEDDGAGLQFPAFQHPTQLFGLLVGKDVTLIEFDAGTLQATAALDITIGPFPAGPVPVSVIVGGSFGVEGHFAVGYSTRGIRLAVKALTDKDPSNDGFFNVTGLLFDGVFFDDLNAAGDDVPEIRLTAEIHAGAEVDIVIASAGVIVGLKATVDLNLHDGGRPTDKANVDGKLYIDEIAKMLNNPICIFDVDGALDAFVKFFVNVGVDPFDFSFDITLVDVRLLDMKAITDPICEHPPPPHLATEDDGSKTLRLNVGPFAGDRDLAENEHDEKVVVRQLDNNPGPGHRYSVTGFGIVQEYPEKGHPLIERIFADGGDGKDAILMDEGVANTNTAGGGVDNSQAFPVTVPVEVCGGSDADQIQGGAAADHLIGDGHKDGSNIHCTSVEAGSDGDDSLGGGKGADTLDGNGGGDSLGGADGNDTINGGTGVDKATGGEGHDTINGNEGSDVLDGGPEQDPAKGVVSVADVSDTINGDAGDDTLDGGFGDDTLNGGVDKDHLSGGDGVDHENGDAGDDVIVGGKAGDVISGGTENDVVFGEDGSDTIDGDAGNDDIVGGKDDSAGPGTGDHVDGGAGRDYVLGDEGLITRTSGNADGTIAPSGNFVGNDVLSGGTEGDVIYGEFGADDINGNAGGDELHGNVGADTMHGGTEDDVMFGDAGVDTMNGDAGVDTMRGGTEDDVMFGDADGDFMFGDSGKDEMFGNAGDDVMRGGIDADTMHGNDNHDVMNGDDAADKMFGDAGPDTMHGDAADDYMEGNADADTMTGDAGQDDMLGGSAIAGQADAGDVMNGGDGVTPNLTQDFDVLVGDNGTITRPGDTKVTGAKVRAVVLYELDSSDASLYGGDTISGDQSDDELYGGGGNDTLHGNAADDYEEGNPGTDSLFGDQGQDDLIGGTSQNGGGHPDGADCIQGDERTNDCATAGSGSGSAAGGTGGGSAGGDVVMGDNASIVRAANAAKTDWVRDSFGSGADGLVRRTVTRYDDNSPNEAVVSGGDRIYGDDLPDQIYGQGGDDTISGGAGDDTIQGNSNAGGSPAGVGSALPGDTIHGDAGQDDIVGGTNDAAIYDGPDTIFGDGAEDVVAGDNAILDRSKDAAGHWLRDDRRLGETMQVVRRNITLLNVDLATQPAPPLSSSGGDAISGGDGYDQLFGQGGGDTVHGDGGDDYVEGNAAGDTLWGDLGDDDVVGGGSASDGVIKPDRSGEDLRDGNDTIHGDAGDPGAGNGDAIAGDNARILRPTTPAGLWRTDADRGATLRDVLLFDVQKVGGAGGFTAPAEASGSDTVFAEGGPDVAFGQGNGAADNAWGTESGAAGTADCFDGADNGDANDPYNPLADLSDPNCRAATPNGDQVYGQSGADYLEGNQGSDLVSGGEAEDDVIGGSSSNDGRINALRTPSERSGATPPPVNLLDGNDAVSGNEDDDTVLGDNGFVDRYLGAGGAWIHINSGAMVGVTTPVTTADGGSYGPYDLVRRSVTSSETPESDGAFGHDLVLGGDGHDDLYGQLGNDWIEGGPGEDAVVADLGRIDDNLLGTAADGLADPAALNQLIKPQQPFLDDTINLKGVLKRQVTLFTFLQTQNGKGNDTVQGNEDGDWIHTGPGEDLANGNDGEDRIWGGDNTDTTPLANNQAKVDALWGGNGHDHLWGGYGADFLDVRPRTTASTPGLAQDDPPTWFQLAGPGLPDYDGRDYIYGGWDQDAMQANFGDNGPNPGDRLLDWSGTYNVYYVCPGTYGDYISTRAIAPGVIAFLQNLSQGDGASNTATAGTSGFRETAIVFTGDVKSNTNPVHPDTPGHFTCGGTP